MASGWNPARFRLWIDGCSAYAVIRAAAAPMRRLAGPRAIRQIGTTPNARATDWTTRRVPATGNALRAQAIGQKAQAPWSANRLYPRSLTTGSKPRSMRSVAWR